MADAILTGGGGGGTGSDDCTVTAANVMAGKTYVGADTDDEIGTGTLALTGTAAAAQVLSGYTFYNTNPQSKVTGTIASKAAATYTPGTAAQTIAAGQYLSGAQTISSLGGTATAAVVRSGYTFSSDSAGRAIAGTLASLAGGTFTPSIATQTVSSSGKYMTSNVVINPIPSNYINVNNSQTVFSNGSYGTIASLGAYLTNSRYYFASQRVGEATIYNSAELHNTLNSITYTVMFFRNMFNSAFKYIDVTVRGTTTGLTMHIIISDGTGSSSSIIKAYVAGVTSTSTVVTANLSDLSLTSDFALALYTNNTNWHMYVSNVTLRSA